VGAVVAAFVRELSREIDNCTTADTARLGLPAVDLLSALLAHELEAPAATPEAWRGALFMRIRSFAEARLGDPNLGPEMIAAAHHVSVRLVHKLFQEHGVTVSRWIRHRRLERCRQDLADPALATRPVRLVAARWGFRSEAHFNRTFRQTYGTPPGEWRTRQTRRPPG
jgi:AraC-like DNA-binding protein